MKNCFKGEKMKNICVFTLYPELGASSKYRIFLYKEDLESKFNVKWFSFWNDSYVRKYMHHKKNYILQILLLYLFSFFKRLYQLFFVAPKADICFFQKACIPKFPYNHIATLKKKGIRIIFDVDDAVYTSKRDFSDRIAKLSDVIICGNKSLKNHYLDYNKNIVVLPTVENTNLFKPYWKDTFGNKTIGWIGSLTTINNLDVVVDAINRIVEEYPQVNFIIISNSALDYTVKIKNTRLIKWSKDSYISDLSSITVGIMPLKDNEFNRGKCGFKLIQYLSLKKPVIASDVGVNQDIVGSCGILANTEKEWHDALELILMNEQKYKKLVNNIENVFAQKYSYDENLKKIISILDCDKA